MKLLVCYILVASLPTIILSCGDTVFDLNVQYENYNPKNLLESVPGYGRTWMYFPNQFGIPQIAFLNVSDKVLSMIQIRKKDIKFHLYTRLNKEKSQLLSINHNETLFASNFNANRPTKIITHGWFSSQDSDFSQSLKNNYLQVEDVNIILVDWSAIASNPLYPIPAVGTKKVGHYVGIMVNFLADNGLNINDLHLIGHSLGAHVSGCAATEIENGKIARITGLDPALPKFGSTKPLEHRLDKEDAQFVDIIHTCGGILGYYSDIGHADFYPNGGVPRQPECYGLPQVIEGCSHGKAWKYYADSIIEPNMYLAKKCASWILYKQGMCNDCQEIPMGFSTPQSAEGFYYVDTTHAIPNTTESVHKIVDNSIGNIIQYFTG